MVDSIRTAWVGFMLLHSQDDVEERERSQALKTERAIVQAKGQLNRQMRSVQLGY